MLLLRSFYLHPVETAVFILRTIPRTYSSRVYTAVDGSDSEHNTKMLTLYSIMRRITLIHRFHSRQHDTRESRPRLQHQEGGLSEKDKTDKYIKYRIRDKKARNERPRAC